MDRGMIYCMTLCIHVDNNNKNNSKPCHLAANQCKSEVWEQKKDQGMCLSMYMRGIKNFHAVSYSGTIYA